MKLGLDGKIAVVTGAGSGIGAAVSRQLAEEGAEVVVADLDSEAARAVAAAIRSDGGKAREHAVDVSDAEAVRKLVDDGRKKNPPETVTTKPEDLDVSRGVIVYKDDPNKKIKIADVISFAGNPIVGKGAHIYESTWQRMAWAAGVAEVEVDRVSCSRPGFGAIPPPRPPRRLWRWVYHGIRGRESCG